jgi:hypothetical protein
MYVVMGWTYRLLGFRQRGSCERVPGVAPDMGLMSTKSMVASSPLTRVTRALPVEEAMFAD